MKATDAHYQLGLIRAAICATYPRSPVRAVVVSRLMAVESALAAPASLCTNDELFDAVLCADVEPGEPSLLDELLDQVGTGALVAYVSARLAAETERSRRIREDLDFTDPTEAP